MRQQIMRFTVLFNVHCLGLFILFYLFSVIFFHFPPGPPGQDHPGVSGILGIAMAVCKFKNATKNWLSFRLSPITRLAAE